MESGHGCTNPPTTDRFTIWLTTGHYQLPENNAYFLFSDKNINISIYVENIFTQEEVIIGCHVHTLVV